MPATPLYPIFLNLAGRPVLVVGAGAVAHRKVKTLLEAGAAVTVVSPAFADSFAEISPLEKIPRPYDSPIMLCKKWTLAFAATNLPAVNQQVQSDAAAAAILCCRCDQPADFIGAATASTAGVTLAITTGGASPALARRIRDQAHASIEPTLAQLAELLEDWRPQLKTAIPNPDARRALLLKLAGPEMEHQLRTVGPAAAQELFRQWLTDSLAAAATPPSPVDHAR